MSEVILQYLKEHKQFINKEELKKKLKIKGEQQTNVFLSALTTLVENGSLFFDARKGYRLFDNNLGLAFGELEINRSGNGFVHTTSGDTIFIDKSDLNGALHGDNVTVSSITTGRKDQYKGEINKVIKRKTGNVIFEVIGNSYQASLVPYNPNESVPVTINKNSLKNLVDGELILIKVGTTMIDNSYIGEIIKTLGHKDDPGVDLKLIYNKYNIPIEFSDEALKEAKNLPTEVTEEEIIGRVDLRDKQIITIDCDDTKDRDDAVYVEKLPNGNYKLYTSISHISHYVKKDSSLYKEASIRNTSHYPNNTCNPMFPHTLSNGICSLNENVDRLTRTCEMEIDNLGNVVNYDIYLSVINSKKAMKYSEVNDILNGIDVYGYAPYKEQLLLMNELSDILEENRIRRNCIDFDIPDLGIVQNKSGKVEKITERNNGKSGRIIENFMLVTGSTVAEAHTWLPFIYRVHESPDSSAIYNAINLLRKSGFNIPKYNNVDEKTIIDIINRVGSTEEGQIVKSILLKSMERARYDIIDYPHYALQLEHHCHFTSPIRRFTDFRIHMLLDELETFDYSIEATNKLEDELYEIAKSASRTERIAMEIEDEALMMAMAEYMEGHIGEEYEAIITEVYKHGMFVKTKDNITGKIKFDNMTDDKYHFDPDKKAVIGKNHNKKHQIGNKIYVLVKDACKQTRTINFETISNKPKTLTKEK